MTLLQALLIAFFGYLSSIFSPWLSLGGWYTLGRPFISGFVIGIILGDIPTGILMGAAVQAVFIGLVTPGGSMPADANLAAYIGIPLAMVSKMDATFAVSLSVLLSFIGVLAVLIVVTVNCLFVHRMDRLLSRGKLSKAARTPIVAQITNFTVRFFPIFLACYFGQGVTESAAHALPAAVVGVLAMFGTLLPLVGFAMLLNTIVRKKTDLLFYIFGFILAQSLHLPILSSLMIGCVVAFLDVRISVPTLESPDAEAAAPERKRLLTKRDVVRCYWEWMLWHLSAQNMERMQAPALVRMFSVVKDRLYPGDSDRQRILLQRHTSFFNTEPYIGSIVPGIVLGMEEENAICGKISDEMITSMKTALMGSFAGIGDSLYVGTMIPILLAVAIGISGETGSILGPVFYILAHLGIMFPLTWLLFRRGYETGLNSVSQILGDGKRELYTRGLVTVALVVAGAITASTVQIQSGWVYQSASLTIDLNTVLEGLFPGFLTLGLALLMFLLMRNKKMPLVWMFLLCLVLAIVGLLTRFFTIG